MITNEQTAGTQGLPAYKAAADKWLDAKAASGFYAGDFKAAVSTAAASVWSGWGLPQVLARDLLVEDHRARSRRRQDDLRSVASLGTGDEERSQVEGYDVN